METLPKNYDLQFEPNLDTFTFDGKEKITVDCKKPTKLISLNCAEIKIHSCHIKYKNRTIECQTKTDDKKENLSIFLKDKVKGLATIVLEFEGIVITSYSIHYTKLYESQHLESSTL